MKKTILTIASLASVTALLSFTHCHTSAPTAQEQPTPTTTPAPRTETETAAPAPEHAMQAPSGPNIILPSDTGFRYVGRMSHSNPNAVRMGFTGAQIYARFTGTSVRMRMKPGSGFFAVVIDDGKPRMVQSLRDTTVLLAQGLKPGTHSLAISQCTEAADVDYPVFYGLQLDRGARLAEAPALPTRRIEFIGNSITCGKGALDNTKAKDRDDIAYESWYISYDAEVARRLNAQCMVVARSGIGIYRNNGGRRSGDALTMQYYYTRTLCQEGSEMWDATTYEPDLICINLGTNDTAQTYDVELLKQGARKFLQDVHNLHPRAKMVVLTGPMRSGQRLADQKAGLDYAVAQLKADGFQDVYRFDLPRDNGQYGYGTGRHPAVGEHSHMADILTPYLKDLMKW